MVIKKPKTICSVCSGLISDNVNPEKILICAHCVLALKDMGADQKLYYRDKLLDTNRLEAARSIESFINPEEVKNGNERIEDRTVILRKVSRRGFGNLKGKSLHITPKRIALGQYRGQVLLSRIPLHELDNEKLQTSQRSPTGSNVTRRDNNAISQQQTVQEGITELMSQACPSCNGVFCKVIEQKISHCHRLDDLKHTPQGE